VKLFTHAVCAAILSSLLPLNPVPVIIGGILPDVIDYIFRLQHRNKATHNILLPLAICLISPDASALALGLLHHLLLDIVTAQGVYVGPKRVRVGSIHSVSFLANSATILAHIMLLTIFL